MKYMITNGNIYISKNQSGYHHTADFQFATRFSFNVGNAFITDFLDCDPNWVLRKVSDFKSGRNYVITNGNTYVTNTTKNELTGNYKKAKWFRSVADAQAYINNHSNLFSPVYIIDENGVEQENQENRKFTDEQLDILGVVKSQKVCSRIVIKKSTKEIVYEKYGGKCGLCGKKIPITEMTIDHILPLTRGGTNEVSNLQPSCKCCNQLKSNMKNDELMQSMTKIFANTIQNNPNGDLSDYLIRTIVRSRLRRMSL